MMLAIDPAVMKHWISPAPSSCAVPPRWRDEGTWIGTRQAKSFDPSFT